MAYLWREAREAQIIAGATQFFAEHGLDAHTRQLSAFLGITQPLLYRYFPSKQHLLDRIFDELFVKRWDPRWKMLLADDSLPLAERIRVFYQEFDEQILSREWVRLFIFSGLGGYSYNRRVFRKLASDIFRPLCLALRKQHGVAAAGLQEITREELEMLWELHGVVFYHRLRQYVYGMQVSMPIAELTSNLLFYLEGAAPRVFEAIASRSVRSAKKPV